MMVIYYVVKVEIQYSLSNRARATKQVIRQSHERTQGRHVEVSRHNKPHICAMASLRMMDGLILRLVVSALDAVGDVDTSGERIVIEWGQSPSIHN